ncbi:hypothetical protein HKX48_001664 [Thoreauomyces humboldtii]|nr:hypothetical protein HKX48_001664 [Thoreauomyces humboldtii]
MVKNVKKVNKLSADQEKKFIEYVRAQLAEGPKSERQFLILDKGALKAMARLIAAFHEYKTEAELPKTIDWFQPGQLPIAALPSHIESLQMVQQLRPEDIYGCQDARERKIICTKWKKGDKFGRIFYNILRRLYPDEFDPQGKTSVGFIKMGHVIGNLVVVLDEPGLLTNATKVDRQHLGTWYTSNKDSLDCRFLLPKLTALIQSFKTGSADELPRLLQQLATPS